MTQQVVKKFNRNNSKAAKKCGEHWCSQCDRDVVGDLGKCSYCNSKSKKIKIPKLNLEY